MAIKLDAARTPRDGAIERPWQVHRPTGRSALVVCEEDFLRSKPTSVDGQKYILFTASEKQVLSTEVTEARSWIEAGTGYMCAWGPASSELDDLFDYATFLPELGTRLPFTLMTTWHDKGTLEEALWFAFYCATAPDDLKEELRSVVMLVDSSDLAERCSTWVLENTE
jgi:hypothetical protein